MVLKPWRKWETGDLLRCPTPGCGAPHPHFENHCASRQRAFWCDLIRCKACRGYGTRDGKRWSVVNRKEAA